MENRDRTAAIIDGTLNFLITGSAIAGGLLLPNLLVALDKPLNVFWKKLDKRGREREMRRTITYMKSRDLIRGDYEHGLQITEKGRKRLEKIEFEKLSIKSPDVWDKKWRLVFYDIPETKKPARNALTSKLRYLGFYQLQRSAWVHPFPCREIIEKVSSHYNVDDYISYIETTFIDNEEKLKQKFKDVL